KHLQDAEQLASMLDDQRQLARVSNASSHHFLVTGNAEEARRYGMRAFDIAETLGDIPLQVPVNLYLGAAGLGLAEFHEADEHLGRTVRLLQGVMARERFGLHGYPAVIARSYLAWSLAERGDFAGAIARGQEGVDIAEAAHHAYSLAYVCWGLAMPHVL